jgi:hypothetical protein
MENVGKYVGKEEKEKKEERKITQLCMNVM